MDQKEIDRIFYDDGYRLAKHHLDEKLGASQLKAAIEELYQSIDKLLEAFLTRAAEDGIPSDCKKGCAWCCHQEVFAVSHEFLYLNEHVKQQLSPETRKRILKKAREKVKLTMNLSVEEQLRIRAACPFLEDASCIAYEARPMACRIYLSASASSCKLEYDHPDKKEHNPELYEFPLQAGRMLNEGFVAYLKEKGLQVAELPIEQGYSSMLTLGQTMEDWVASIQN